MCLLASVADWSADAITCLATSHLDPANPLRSRGRLAARVRHRIRVAGRRGARRAARGRAAAAGIPRGVAHGAISAADRLDDPALGTLAAHARREHGDANGLLYAISLAAEDGRVLLAGRATIILQRA